MHKKILRCKKGWASALGVDAKTRVYGGDTDSGVLGEEAMVRPGRESICPNGTRLRCPRGASQAAFVRPQVLRRLVGVPGVTQTSG
jgi:hypothetical protein